MTEKLTTYSGDKKREYVPPPDDYNFPLLDDVYGNENLLNSLEDVIDNVFNRQIFDMFKCKPNTSYLFTGPPGTGKSFSFKAIRNELYAEGLNIASAPYNIGDFGTAYINQGAKILQTFFNNGRKIAHKGVTVLYWFDESDVLMSKRGGVHSHKEDDKLLDCLMKNMQNINSYSTNEYIFFATNFLEAMDPAAIRAGRIDKIIKFDLPTKEARRKYLRDKIKRYNKEISKEGGDSFKVFKRMNYNRLTNATKGLNFAELDSIFNSSIRKCIQEEISKDDLVLSFKLYETQLIKNINEFKKEREKEKKARIGFV